MNFRKKYFEEMVSFIVSAQYDKILNETELKFFTRIRRANPILISSKEFNFLKQIAEKIKEKM